LAAKNSLSLTQSHILLKASTIKGYNYSETLGKGYKKNYLCIKEKP